MFAWVQAAEWWPARCLWLCRAFISASSITFTQTFIRLAGRRVGDRRCLARLSPPLPQKCLPFGGSARKVKLLFFPGEAKVKTRLDKQNHKPIYSQTTQITRDQTHIAKMAAIGSLVFCTDCGNLLETNTSRKTFLTCEVCGAQNKGM